MGNTTMRKAASFTDLFDLRGEERAKVFSLCIFKGIISVVYVVMRMLKKSLVVTSPGGCSEAIASVKGMVVLPGSILMVSLYMYLAMHYSLERLLYGFLFLFVGFLLLYGFVLLPYEGVICPHVYAEDVVDRYPHYKHWVALIRLWPHVLFFFMAEMWGQMMILVFFWRIAAHLCDRETSKRYFHIYIGSGCLAGLFPLVLMAWLGSRYQSRNEFRKEALPFLLGIAVAGILLALLFWRWMVRRFSLLRERVEKQSERGQSLWEGISYIKKNPYLIGVLGIVLGCSISMTLVEVTHDRYVNAFSKGGEGGFVSFQSFEGIILHLAVIFASFFLNPYISRWFGWRVLFYIAPITVLFLGSLFFGMSYYRHHIEFTEELFGIPPESFVVYLGALFKVGSKIVKYMAFDNAKEILYTYVSKEERNRSKAAVDVMGSRIGKSFSSYLHLFSLWFFHTDDVRVATPMLLFFFLLICLNWLGGVRYITRLNEGE